MRTIEYNNIGCDRYEVMATEEGHFSKKCDYLFLFRKNEYGEYIPVQEVGGKVLLVHHKLNN